MIRNFLGAAVLTTILAVGSFAQQEDKAVRRLGSVTWNPAEHKLTWTVSKGMMSQGKFVESDSQTFEIDMDSALMTANGEDRLFSKNEAVSVHALMDLVAKYAAESTVWWDAGKGERVTGEDKAKIKRGERLDSQDDYDEAPRRRTPAERSVIKIKL